MRIVFCGTGDIGLPSLKALADSARHELVGVITQPDRPAGRDLHPRPPAVKTEALARGVPVAQPERIRKDFSALAAWAPDLMVVAAYGQILPRAVLEIPRLGCLNLHASLLPRHRGASPVQASILAGDTETGVTVMYVDEGLDTGDILLARGIPIFPNETAGALHDRLADLAPSVLMESLDLLEGGSAPRVPQDSSLATYAPKLGRQDGRLDWREPAGLLARRVRAMTPWPGASARFVGGGVLKIHSAEEFAPIISIRKTKRQTGGESGTGFPACEPAQTQAGKPVSHSQASRDCHDWEESADGGPPGTVLSAGPGGILVAAGDGSLALREVQLEGKKRLSAGEFLRGFPVPAGTAFDLSFSVPP
ncbi:MAG: methionyl-tRNA formyltransferase [Verrucomicrobiota bacterium]